MQKNVEWSDEIVIDRFLKKIQVYLRHLPALHQGKILDDVATLIKDGAHERAIKVDRFVKELGYPSRYIEIYLQKKGYPKGKRRFSPFKLLLISSTSFIAIIFIALILFIRSLFPLFEVNEREGVVRVFGGKFVFPQNQNINTKDSPFSFKGEIERSQFQKRPLIIRGIDAQLQTNYLDGPLKYDCRSKKENNTPMSSTAGNWVLDLGSNTGCTLSIPSGVQVTFELHKK